MGIYSTLKQARCDTAESENEVPTIMHCICGTYGSYTPFARE